LEAFIEAGLWDEIRVETNHRLLVADGTRAPQFPNQAKTKSHQEYGGNSLDVFVKM